MSDLISRSELINYLDKERKQITIDSEKYNIDSNVVDGMVSALQAFENKVKEVESAYDIGKVVEELGKNASRYTKKYLTPYGNNGYRDTKAISVNKAIEIVKQGCVGKDVE